MPFPPDAPPWKDVEAGQRAGQAVGRLHLPVPTEQRQVGLAESVVVLACHQ